MKYQKVVLDNWTLITTTFFYLLLAAVMWVFIRLLCACIRFPQFMRTMKRLQEETVVKEIEEEDYIISKKES